MNWVDLLLIVVALFPVISGWHRGFLLGSIDLLTWLGSLVLAYIFYPYAADGLARISHFGVWLLPLAFILTAIVARLLIGLVTKFIIRTIPDRMHDNPVNKFLGLVPGAVNGLILAVIISAMLFSLPLKDSVTREARNSRFAETLAMRSEWANRKLTPVFGEAVRQTITSITVSPDSNKEVELSFTYEKATEQPALEVEMLAMVNKERASHGLKPLLPDPPMTQVGRAHSRDMFVRGYFAHVNPDGLNPFDRMKKAGLSFTTAGENLALAPTLEIAHTNLMNSPGHRANILNPGYGHLGIGILDGGYYGLMISQEFRE